jgi:hypothetical protein
MKFFKNSSCDKFYDRFTSKNSYPYATMNEAPEDFVGVLWYFRWAIYVSVIQSTT